MGIKNKANPGAAIQPKTTPCTHSLPLTVKKPIKADMTNQIKPKVRFFQEIQETLPLPIEVILLLVLTGVFKGILSFASKAMFNNINYIPLFFKNSEE